MIINNFQNNMIKYIDQFLDGSFDEIKNQLKDAISNHTWQKMETHGIPFTINGIELSIISGAKWGRVAMHSSLLTIDEDEKIIWRFKNREYAYVNKKDLLLMHKIVNKHISQNTKWEYELNKEIDKAESIEELQEIADRGHWKHSLNYTIEKDQLIYH